MANRGERGEAPAGSLAELAQLESRGKGGVFGGLGGGAPHFVPSEISLPPEVEGKRRGELVLVLGPLVVTAKASSSAGFDDPEGGPRKTTLSYRFWGQEDLQEGNYVSLRALEPKEPSDERRGSAEVDGENSVRLSIPIRCSPANFTRYLKDSQALQVTAFVGGLGEPLGRPLFEAQSEP